MCVFSRLQILPLKDERLEGRKATYKVSQEVEATLRGHRTNTGSEMQPTSMWKQDTRRVGMQSTENWGFGVTVAS